MSDKNLKEGLVQEVEHAATVRLVGLGASAGGLEALTELVKGLPQRRDLAFVVALHHAPEQDAVFTSLLAPHTALRVENATDGAKPEAGTIYLAPPHSDVTVRDGVLQLSAPSSAVAARPSINALFASLAEELGDQAIAVVLSGSSTDGALGVRAIKGAGGAVIAQDPATTRFDGMPRAAVQTGCVDVIAPLAEIGTAIARLAAGTTVFDRAGETSPLEALDEINELVRRHTSFRLSDYKTATVLRRIARRLGVLGLSALGEYTERLRRDRDEAAALMREVFIPVTSFFRDEEAFEALASQIVELVRTAEDGRVLRAWVAACASGEEAYTLAFLFEEALRTLERPGVQYVIFASDMHEGALRKARAATYSAEELSAVPDDLRARYLEPQGGQFRVLKGVRNRIVFARQNLTDDPPFSRLDLLTCRNLLIYFNQAVQKRVLELAHLALNRGGLLLLGRSEVIAANSPLFEPLDARHRLYRRKDHAVRHTLPPRLAVETLVDAAQARERATTSGPDWVAARVADVLLERHAPPAVVIDQADQVVHFQGRLQDLLRFPRGRADMSLFNLVGDELRAELRALVFRARRSTEPVTGGAWTVSLGGHPHTVRITAAPLSTAAAGLLLLTFDLSANEIVRASPMPLSTQDSLIIGELERELAGSRTHLNLVVEEFETSNEELQLVNEELQSTKEELQSTNEELQTSNQQLQASNEELLTVNEELRAKSADLVASVEDLGNVKESLAFPLLVVDAELRVTHGNEQSRALFTSVDAVVGRSLAALPWGIDVTGLIDQVRELVSRGRTFERDLQGNEVVYRLRAMPYRSRTATSGGAVLVFEDVTRERRALASLSDERRRLQGVIDGTNAGTFETNMVTGAVELNETYARLMGYELAELQPVTVAKLRELGTPEDIARAWEALQAHVRGQAPFFEVERHVQHKDGSWRWFLDRGKLVTRTADGRPELVLGTRLDITHLKQAERALADKQAQLEAFVRHAPVAMAMLDREMRFLEVSERWRQNARYGPKAITGVSLYDAVPNATAYREVHQRALAGEHVKFPEAQVVHDNGEVHWSQAELVPWRAADGSIGGILITTEDITDRVNARLALERLNSELEARVADRVADIERARAELSVSVEKLDRALAENQEHLTLLQEMVDRLPYGVVVYEHDNRALAWNREFLRVNQVPPEQLKPGWTMLEFFRFMMETRVAVEPPTPEDAVKTFRALIARGPVRRTRQFNDGQWVELNVGALPHGRVVVTTIDITAQKQNELGLVEAKRRLELASSAGVVGTFFVDIGSGEMVVDEVGRRLLGFSSDQKLNWADFANAPQYAARWQDRVRQVEREGTVEFSFDAPAAGGRKTSVRGRLTADAQNKPKELSGVLVDITDRSRVEEMLRERADAESRGHEEARLRSIQLQKRELVGNLTGGIAHDFNNLLTVLSFATESLQETVDLGHPETQRAISDLQVAIERATLMTRRLLGFSRTTVDEIHPIDSEPAFRAIADLLPRLTGGRISVNVSADPDAWINGSASSVEQVVLNLAVNARDAMPEGGTLTCTLRKLDKEVVITVSDTGVGMSDEVKQRIFEPFFTTKSSGTGLGLATVHDIVQRLGGTIRCESTAGHGTTFVVSFPRVVAPAVSSSTSSAARRLKLSGRVLLVDDDTYVRRATQQVLELHGLDVTSVSSGLEALALVAANERFDVVVSDISMPGMDGLEMGERLADLDPSLPVVFISGNQAPDATVLTRSNRAFVPKPMQPAVLLAAIQSTRRKTSTGGGV